jgi:hypothetical protein
MKVLAILFMSIISAVSSAQSQQPSAPVIEELRWVDNGYLERQRNLIEEIGRSEFGVRVRKDISDLRLLQRIMDEGLINQTQLVEQQAMGVVLGDIYVNELGLEWRVYQDEEGKSRAVCLPNTSHCLFPITMISKRASLGVKPNIRALYERGVSLIEEHLPKMPYSTSSKGINAR